MRLPFVLTVLWACGPSYTSTVTLPNWQSSMATSHARHQKACESGNVLQCFQYGKELLHLDVQESGHPDWQVTWPVDRAGAKQALMTSCTTEELHRYRRDACELLLTQKLVTADEGFAMCTADDKPAIAICSTVAKAGTFDAHQWYQLCSHTAFLCDDAMPHLTDAADKAFADMGTKFSTVGVKITGYAAHYFADEDDDDDGTASSSDSACHKDTDCKGDRICQAGSCVDAGTKAAKPVGLGLAECDELTQLIETKVFSCSHLVDQPLRDAYQDFKTAWSKVEPERLKAMAPICKQQTASVNEDLDHVHCN